MHRRDVLLQLSAAGFLAGLPVVAALPERRSPFAFLTDQPGRHPDAAWIVRVAPNAFLSPSWYVGLRFQSICGALGAANAVLLMESLRDLRASVLFARREGDIELIGATLPAECRRQHRCASDHDRQMRR